MRGREKPVLDLLNHYQISKLQIHKERIREVSKEALSSRKTFVYF